MINITQSREYAYKILFNVFDKKAYINIEQNKLISFIDNHKDRALCHEIVFGTMQKLYFIDFVIKTFSKINIKKISLPTLLILRLSVYQMYFLDKIPVSAVVNEAVNLTKKYDQENSGFVNAVLHACLNKDLIAQRMSKLSHTDYISTQYTVPMWILKILIDGYGIKDAEKIAKSFSIKKDNFCRINSLKCLEDNKSEFEILPYAKRIKIDQNTKDQFLKGDFFVEGLSSQLCVEIMDPKENETILDSCSAPGGKSFASAMKMNNKGNIISCDVFPHKIKLVENTALTLGIKIIKPKILDMSVYHEEFFEKFDKVLCDVPCSGFGIINKKPDIIFKKESSLREIISLSKSILDNCSKYVKKGGTLVFSTCTLNRYENDLAVREFLRENPRFEIEKISKYENENFRYGKLGLTILPDENFDGFFVSKMKRIN